MQNEKTAIILFVLIAIITNNAQAQTATYYKYNVWKGKNNVAYITSVYSFDIPNYRITDNYSDEMKGKFLKSLEIDGIADWNSYYFIDMPDDKNKSEMEEKRVNYIASLKRDGYTVKTSSFTWKLKDLQNPIALTL
jgi:hypothetical protein